MAEFPALPLFTDAYLGDTTHLTTFEHGAYLLLLFVSWRSPGCCLPDDDVKLARHAQTTVDKWRKIRPTIAEFFSIRDGLWHQARLQDEFRHLQSRRDQQRQAGNASAAAKALKRQERGSTIVGDPLQRKANGTATPTPTPTPISSEAKASGADAPDPAAIIFGAGLRFMIQSGVPERQARSMLGKWRRNGDAEVIAALGAAKREGAIEPIEFIEGIFRRQKNGRTNEKYGPSVGAAIDWIAGAGESATG